MICIFYLLFSIFNITMLTPLSWLKEYVDITLPPEELGDKLTEIGLGTEKIEKTKDDTIFEFEITPNRPDLLSILGIAREIAAVEEKKIQFPKFYDLKEVVAFYGSDVNKLFEQLWNCGGFPEPFLSADADFHRLWRRTHTDIILRQDLLQ